MNGTEAAQALGRPEHWAEPSAPLLTGGLAGCGHADVRARLADPSLRTPPVSGDPALMRMFSRTLLQLDGDRHRRVRERFAEHFGPRAVEALAPEIGARAHALIDALAPPADLVADFARPLPFGVIARVLGVPEERAPWVHARLVDMREGFYGDGGVQRAVAAVTDLLDAVDEMDLPVLRGAAGEERADAVANCVFFIEAGHATITSLVAGAALLVLAHPQAPRDDVNGIVEEALRLVSPVTGVVRGEPAEYVFLAAANRDPSVFARPARYDPRRRPNPHVAFSHGAHFCLGAPLSRLHARLAVRALLDRLPGLRLDGEPEWSGALPLHELARLPVTWA